MGRVLVIDDDPLVQVRLKSDLQDSQLELVMAGTAAEGLDKVRSGDFAVALLDIMLPDAHGLETFRQIREFDAKLPVIFITAGTDSDTAIEAMKLGAFDYLVKPLARQHVQELVARAVRTHHLMRTPVEFAEQPSTAKQDRDLLIGRCPAIQRVYKAIGRVAPQDVTVLIRGESGTGKELVARAIYQHSQRRDGPFLAINCAAIPESLLESEIFGYEKGAFTGANERRIGKFEQCSGGTLFLDEIGDMTPATQTKVLRLLQDQTFERVGGTETIRTDVRIIAATNRDLESGTRDGTFRQDLYYRLNVFAIELPALRERSDDLPLLIQHFLTHFGRELNKPVQGLSPDAMDLLLRYRWPGNIRELQSVLKRALVEMTGNVVIPDFLPGMLRSTGDNPLPNEGETRELEPWRDSVLDRISQGSEDLYAEMLAIMERELLTTVLEHTRGNQLQAARILGLSRGTLRTKIRQLGISIEQIVQVAPDSESH